MLSPTLSRAIRFHADTRSAIPMTSRHTLEGNLEYFTVRSFFWNSQLNCPTARPTRSLYSKLYLYFILYADKSVFAILMTSCNPSNWLKGYTIRTVYACTALPAFR